MKRILINATHSEEIRVALCKDHHLYDFDLENRTREQKKANIYKGHVTRVEPSLEAVFVEYGSTRQGFLPLREIAPEYLKGNPRTDNIRDIIKEGDEVIVQVEKEERGNKGAALSTYISLAGRYLVLMPNNAKAGGISRQISGKVREETKNILASLSIPRGMSVIVRTAGLGKGFDELQTDLDHLLQIWQSILAQNKSRPSPYLVHQEAGVVTRAVRDYLRDDIGEVWIDNENAYNEAASFIAAVMPSQMGKLRKYTDYEPLFARFGIERQIETAYQREVRLPSGGSIVIDQTEALVSIDINSAKSTKGSDVAETAYHTNLEAADEIARQLRLRDMGGLIVIDFIDMNETRHQKDVEKRLIDATRYDRARVQFAEISKFGLMEMSRQRLRPSLEESTGYICPRCHGNGMIRDLRSLALSIMRQIEQIALKERTGEIQAEVPTEIAAFLLNEKRESLVYLEQDSGARITILPHAHLESPNFSLHFNPDGFAPSSYERIVAEEEQHIDRGYDVNWQTQEAEPTKSGENRWQKATSNTKKDSPKPATTEPHAVAWLANLFAPKPQAKIAGQLNNKEAAAAIESIINAGGVSLGTLGQVAFNDTHDDDTRRNRKHSAKKSDDVTPAKTERSERTTKNTDKTNERTTEKVSKSASERRNKKEEYAKREIGSHREPRSEVVRGETLAPQNTPDNTTHKANKHTSTKDNETTNQESRTKVISDDIVLHVSAVEVDDKSEQVIHLSLDDNKPKRADKTTVNAKSTVSTDVSTQATADDTPEDVTPSSSDVNTADKPTQAVETTTVTPPTAFNISAEQIALAQQMQRAVNDPRVVQTYRTKSTAITIDGTAGEFIVRVLGSRSDDFVADFMRAVAQMQDLNTADTTNFSFANYGYAPLSDDILEQFHAKTTADGHFSTTQGKTTVTPQPIGKRATNDPRGQHPSHHEVVNLSVDTADANLEDTAIVDANSTTPEIEAEGQAAMSTLAAEQTESRTKPKGRSKATKDETSVEMIAPTAQTTVTTASMPEQTDSIITVGNTDDMPSDTSTNTNHSHDVVNEQISTESTSNIAKSKQDAASRYKDMIESVSGQLLQSTGILSLVAPKKPRATKPRAPKTTKSPARKTSKIAQKSEVVKKRSTAEVATNTTDDETPQS